MAQKTIIGRAIQKHDIEENWLKAVNFTPYQGEIIIYDIDDNYDYQRIKIGDGKTNVNDLPFATDHIQDQLEEHTHNWNDVQEKPFEKVASSSSTVLYDGEVTTSNQRKDGVSSLVVDNTGSITLKKDCKYIVSFNGNRYECEVTQDYSSVTPVPIDTVFYVLGNISFPLPDDGEDTGEPFAISYTEIENMGNIFPILQVCTNLGVGTYSLKIEEYPVVEKFTGVIEYENILNKPTKLSEFENDLNIVTSWNDLEDKPFYDTSKVTELCNGTYEFADASESGEDIGIYGNIQKLYTREIVENEKLVVVYDDNVYNFTAKPVYSASSMQMNTYAGNNAILAEYCDIMGLQLASDTIEDTGEPICIWEGSIFTKNTESIHTISISLVEGELKKLDPKFLPEHSWNTLEDKPFGENVELVELDNGVYSSMVLAGMNYINGINITCLEGQKMQVSWDGVDYEVEVKNIELDGQSCLVFGNASIYNDIAGTSFEDSGEPFLYDSSNVGYLSKDPVTDIQIITSIKETELKQLDPKFLPEHAHSWNDLEDRPFYEAVNTVTKTISWDGNIEGLENVSDNYYKVSDEVANSIQEYHNGVVKFYYYYYNTNEESIYDEIIDIDSDVFKFTDNLYFITDILICFDDTSINGQSITKGTYFINRDNNYNHSYIQSLEYKTTETEVKKIDEKFLPSSVTSWNDLEDRPFYDSRRWVEKINAVGEFDEVFSDMYGKEMSYETYGFIDINEEGKTVKMLYDEVEYISTTKEFKYTQKNGGATFNMYYYYIGNGKILHDYFSKTNSEVILEYNNKDTGEDFVLAFNLLMQSAMFINTIDTEVKEHSIIISVPEGELKKLDPKFLPDGIGTQSDWVVNDENDPAFIKNRPFYTTDPQPVEIFNGTCEFIDGNTSSNGVMAGFYYSSSELTFNNGYELVEGDKITIIYDGVTYNLVIKNDNGYYGDMSIPTGEFAGNGSYIAETLVNSGLSCSIEDTGEPFVLFGNTILVKTTEATHDITIIGYDKVDIAIPTKYLGFNMWKGAGENSIIANDKNNIASGKYSFAEGRNTTASGRAAHAEGSSTTASGDYSHAEGRNTIASGWYSHAEGSSTTASGDFSHTEGCGTIASGWYSHAEGYYTTASGRAAHAEGSTTEAIGEDSHAEGKSTVADGRYSHAEGFGTVARKQATNVIGRYNIPEEVDVIYTDKITTETLYDRLEKSTKNFYMADSYTFDQTTGKFTLIDPVIVVGKEVVEEKYIQSTDFNIGEVSEIAIVVVTNIKYGRKIYAEHYSEQYGKYAHIVGNGNSDTTRSNSHTLDWEGNAEFQGDVIAYGCDSGETPISLKELYNTIQTLQTKVTELEAKLQTAIFVEE